MSMQYLKMIEKPVDRPLYSRNIKNKFKSLKLWNKKIYFVFYSRKIKTGVKWFSEIRNLNVMKLKSKYTKYTLLPKQQHVGG